MRIVFTQSRHPDFLSRMIMAFTGSKWSHCFLMLDDDKIIEASSKMGVSFDSFHSRYAHMKWEIYDLYSGTQIYGAEDFISQPYGFLEVLGTPIAWITGTNPFSDGWRCSELCLWIINQSDVRHYFEFLNPQNVSPLDLWKVVSGHPLVFKKIGESK